MKARTLPAWRWLAALLFGLMLAAALPRQAQAQTSSTCGAAATAGTAPADFRDYCWLNFPNFSDATARTTAGQPYRFALPDGTTMTLTVKVTTVTGVNNNQTAVRTAAVPSWTGSAFGNQAFMNIPGTPVFLNATNGSTVRVTLDNIQVTAPTGAPATYSIIVADGESSNTNEWLEFYTNGSGWTRVASIRNGANNTLFPGEVLNGQTVRINGVSGTVGAYVYRSDNSPTQVRATIKGDDRQGVLIGVRYASISVISQFVGSRYYPTDQVKYMLRTTGGTELVSATTTGTGLNNFPPAVMPTVAASYPFQVAQVMAPGSPGVMANYSTSLTCVNNGLTITNPVTPMPVNQIGTTYTFPSLKYGDSVVCTFTNTPIFASVGGTVYHDRNYNGAQDNNESGTNLANLYVKLVPASGNACNGPALQAVAVTAATGAYNVPNVPAGDYCLVLDNNNTLSDVTPTLPSGWLGVQNASGIAQVHVDPGANPEAPRNFGLFNGSRLTGSLFADVGSGSGGAGANDGVRQAGEAGIAGVTVNAMAGSSTVASAVTSGDGSFTLWLPASPGGAVTIGPAQLPTGYSASGGGVGTTGGSFTRPNLAFTPAAGQVYTGVAIGLVPGIKLSPNGMQVGMPGGVVFYPHLFGAGSGGQVTFSITSSAAASGWTTVLYRDNNCNGAVDGAEPVIGAAITVVAGEEICLVLKQFVPAGSTIGAQNVAVLTASFTFTGASPALSATVSVEDVTTVGEPAALVLQKRVSNVTRGSGPAVNVSAAPGDVLLYTLTAQNQGSEPLTTLAIHDSTAAFTTFVAATCPGTLPPGITACSVTAQPAVGAPGAVRWDFVGALSPSAQLVVTYRVRLDQ